MVVDVSGCNLGHNPLTSHNRHSENTAAHMQCGFLGPLLTSFTTWNFISFHVFSFTILSLLRFSCGPCINTKKYIYIYIYISSSKSGKILPRLGFFF